MEKVAVIDYGMGNLRSVSKALESVAPAGVEVSVSSDPRVIDTADRVVFPGQGAIRDCMAEIRQRGLEPSIRAAIGAKPFLGICMGLQALMNRSDECDHTPGLGVVDGDVLRFPGGIDAASGEPLKVPHMGWNQVSQSGAHPLWEGIEDGARFYFVHSYYVCPADNSVTSGSSHYGLDFTSAIARDNVFAVQFHPEKSQRDGLHLLGNFLRWRP